MLPNVYQLLRANATIVSLVANRIYRHGSAPQNVQKPYITWSLSSGQPENVLNDTPCSDRDTVQIDCWSEQDEQIETLAYTVQDVLDSNGVVNRMTVNLRETDTKLYRMSLEADFIRSR